MNTAYNLLARAVVAFMWGPVDHTVCAWANVTHRDHR